MGKALLFDISLSLSDIFHSLEALNIISKSQNSKCFIAKVYLMKGDAKKEINSYGVGNVTLTAVKHKELQFLKRSRKYLFSTL